MGGAGVTVTATAVERRRVLGDINTARRRARQRERGGKSKKKGKTTKETDRRRGREKIKGTEIDTDLSRLKQEESDLLRPTQIRLVVLDILQVWVCVTAGVRRRAVVEKCICAQQNYHRSSKS